MSLYVVQVPDPAPGVDWLQAVPGQYLYNVIAVHATLLTAAGNPVNATDASGHGLDGTYDPQGNTIAFVPGLVAGDLALAWGWPLTAPAANIAIPQGVLDFNGDWTFNLWCQFSLAVGTQAVLVTARDNAANLNVRILYTRAAGGRLEVFGGPTQWISGAGVVPNDGTTHMVTVTYTGGTMALYVDGAASAWAVVGTPPAVPAFTFGGQLLEGAVATPPGATVYDEAALWNYALGAGDVATIFAAAAVSFPAYAGAVLATSPVEYYHLDDVATATGRQVALEITDGQTTTELIPTGFAESATPGTFQYSWQANLNSSTQTPDQTVTTVATPPLILPPGYTIGARTLDLGATDQWTDISLWWDSNVQDSRPETNPYVYPPGAHLVYHQVEGF